MIQSHYEVSGLVNTQVKTQIKNVLKDIDGVNKVNVDLKTGSVEVSHDEATDENEIRRGIEQVGCKIRSI